MMGAAEFQSNCKWPKCFPESSGSFWLLSSLSSSTLRVLVPLKLLEVATSSPRGPLPWPGVQEMAPLSPYFCFQTTVPPPKNLQFWWLCHQILLLPPPPPPLLIAGLCRPSSHSSFLEDKSSCSSPLSHTPHSCHCPPGASGYPIFSLRDPDSILPQLPLPWL